MTSVAARTGKPDCFIGTLTWADVAGRIAAGAAALLPIGAGAKEHGLHLPLATDEIQARYLAGELARRLAADGRVGRVRLKSIKITGDSPYVFID